MKKKNLPTGVRVLLGFVSVFLCIILFACSVVTILVADVSLVTSRGGIQTLVKDILFPSSTPYRIPMRAPAVIMPGRNPIRFDEVDLSAGAQDAIIDTLYSMLEEQFQGQVPISKEQVETLVNESTLPEFLSDKVSGIVSDVISGEATTDITAEEIAGLLEENKDLVEDTFHVEVTQDVVNAVTGWVEQNDIVETVHKEVANITGVELTPPASPEASGPSQPGSSGAVSGPSSNISAGLDLMDSISKGEVEDFGMAQVLVALRFVTAPAVLLGCIGVCLLLSALLFLTNWGRPGAALCCSGVTYLLAGLLFLIPYAIAVLAPALFASFGIAGNAVRQVLTLTGSVSIGVTVFGLALIIGGAVLGSQLKKRAATAAEAPAEEAVIEVSVTETDSESI